MARPPKTTQAEAMKQGGTGVTNPDTISKTWGIAYLLLAFIISQNFWTLYLAYQSPRTSVESQKYIDKRLTEMFDATLKTLNEITDKVQVDTSKAMKKLDTTTTKASETEVQFRKGVDSIEVMKNEFKSTIKDAETSINVITSGMVQIYHQMWRKSKQMAADFKSKGDRIVSNMQATSWHIKEKGEIIVSQMQNTDEHLKNLSQQILQNMSQGIENLRIKQDESINRIESNVMQNINNLEERSKEVCNAVKKANDEMKTTALKYYSEFKDRQDDLLRTATSDVQSLTRALKERSREVTHNVSDMLSSISRRINDSMTTIDEKHREHIAEASNKSQELVSKFDKSNQFAQGALHAAVSMFKNETITTVTKIQGAMTSSIEKVERTQDASLAKVVATVEKTVENVQETMTTKITDFQQHQEESLKTFGKAAETSLSDIQNRMRVNINKFEIMQTNSLKAVENASQKTVNDIQQTMNEKIEEFHGIQKKSLTHITDSTEDTINGLKSTMDTRIEEFQKTQTDMLKNVELKSVEMVSHLQTSMSSSVVEFQNAQEETLGQLSKSAASTVKEIKIAQDGILTNINKSAQDAITNMNNKGIKLSEVIDTANSRFGENARTSTEILHKTEEQLQQLRNQATSFSSTVTKVKKYEEIFGESTDGLDSKINKTLKEIALPLSINEYITWCIIIGFGLYLVYGNQSQGHSSHQSTPQLTTGTTGSTGVGTVTTTNIRSPVRHRPLVPNIPSGPPVCDIAVVTFSTESLRVSQTMFTKLFRRRTSQFTSLTGELDLAEVPSARGYLVLIGTDSRSTLLEDMDGSSGSRKRLTVTALQQTKGDVMMVYLEDSYNIEEPPPEMLYNPNLSRTTTHPILKDLVGRDRLLTVRHETLTNFQKDHLTTWLQGL